MVFVLIPITSILFTMGKDKNVINWKKLRRHNLEMNKVALRMISKTHLSDEQMEKIATNYFENFSNPYAECVKCDCQLFKHNKLEVTEEHIFYEDCNKMLHKINPREHEQILFETHQQTYKGTD